MNAARAFRQSLRLLGTRRFGTFWFASLLSNIGTWAQQVAEPWLLLSLGASPFLIGLDSFAMNAPVWLLTLVGGVLADRADRRRVIALFQSIQMLCPTLIAALLVLGSIRPFMIIALSLVVGVTDALSMPSFQSIVPSIVRRDQIGRGLALNSTQFNLSRILGPAIAGVLMASIGAVACFALSAASYIPFIGVALWILPRRPSRPRSDHAFDRSDLLTGLREIARAPHLRGALLTVFATSVLCGPLITFTPVLVSAAFHGDASDFSAAVGAFGVGGLLGAAGLLAVPAEQDRRRWSSRLAVLYGLTVAFIALVPWFWGVPALMALAGAAMTMSNTSANSLLQATASPRLLGQTVSLFMLATRGGIPLGALSTGLSIELLGVRPALLANGALAVVVHLAIGRAWIRSPVPKPAAASENSAA
ncbi:MAG: MFS transporter [Roseiarcus sp.]|jgi:MFS family permease